MFAGTGGRIRDVQAAGRGGHVIAATAGYSFGNLHIPGYDLEWEDKGEPYPSTFATPLQVCIEASNGASDYGNKFGEPVLAGFARSFGHRNTQSKSNAYLFKKSSCCSHQTSELNGSSQSCSVEASELLTTSSSPKKNPN